MKQTHRMVMRLKAAEYRNLHSCSFAVTPWTIVVTMIAVSNPLGFSDENEPVYPQTTTAASS